MPGEPETDSGKACQAEGHLEKFAFHGRSPFDEARFDDRSVARVT
jgi:hypothetical protein